MDRSVANLTTEQLYRKRAFDRINQRASRARKKNRVTELEEEVADLKARLARSESEVKRLESSEASLREAINAARSSLRALDAATTNNPVVPSPPASSHTSESVQGEVSDAIDGSQSPSVSHGPQSYPNSALATAKTHNEYHPTTESSPSSDSTAFALRDEATGLMLGLPLPQDFDAMFGFEEGAFSTDWNATNSLSWSFLDHFPPGSDAQSWVSATADLQISDLQEPKQPPIWERLPIHISPTCRLDTVITELAQSSRQHVQNSGPIPELSEQAFPSIRSLLNPESQSSQSPISNAIGKHGRITMNIADVPAKIAAMYNICLYLRWLITPTKRNYEAMPDYLRPIELQLTTPHPAWIDVMVWPEARELFIRHMDWSQFPLLRQLNNKSISVSWPHGLSRIFTALSQKELRLDPLFESHIRKLRNWKLGLEVVEAFPFLKEMKLL